MCDLFEDLREKMQEEKESTSSSYSLSMESAAYYSPRNVSKTPNIDQLKVTTTDGQSTKSENSSYSLEALSVDSSYKEAERGRTVENRIPHLENKSPSSMKVLEDKIIALKFEIETLNCQKGEHEQGHKGRPDEFHKGLKDNSVYQLEFAFKEKEGEVLKKLDECEKFFNGKIEESMDRVLDLEVEVDSLRSWNKNLSHQKEQELESLRIQNQESKFELSKKTKEASVSLEMLESLTEKLQQKTENEAGLVEERDALKQQVKDLEIRIVSINDENENQITTISQLQESEAGLVEERDALEQEVEDLEIRIESINDENENHITTISQLQDNEAGLVKERDALRQQVQDLEIRIESINDENRLSKHENENQRTTISQMQENEAGLVEERYALKQQIKDLEVRIESINDENRLSKDENENQRTTISQLQENEAGLVKERDALKQVVQDLEIVIESINAENRLSKDENENQRTTISQLQENEEGLVEERDALKQQIKELEIRIESINDENRLSKYENENQRTIISQLQENEAVLVEQRDALKQQVKDLEIRIESVNDENRLSQHENENQRRRISQLHEKIQEKDSQISTLESVIESVKRDLSNKIKSLEQKYKSLEIDKMELEGKNDVLAASLEQRDMQVNKLNHEANSSFRSTVKKMGEMVDEFKKKSEDSVRILGRRIRVAEQLHNETREWYQKTREKNEQDRKDCELALHSIKIIMSMVSDTLSVSETFGLRFVECCEAFTNRVSKVSCEIYFVKDWMKRKNGALVQLKKDFDELVVQLDDKENEILSSRQKVLKLESKLRDLEKIVKEDDETMIVLKEEKREAIRQLCVWIDYHRGRSDFFKKAFFELVATYQRTS